MVLNELETAYRIAKGEIIVTPLIDPMVQFGPSSLDVRLGTEFQVTRRSKLTHLDPLQHPDRVVSELHEYTEDFAIGGVGYFVLHPGEFALGCTLEYIRLPHDLVLSDIIPSSYS
jgi:dCTP deaminase